MLIPAFGCAAGCLGVSNNPSYFPYWLPAGDDIWTHAKPIGPGYHANFDPHAVDLVVEPATMTSQVGSQVVILATVRDGAGVPLRNRRVEWIVMGGNLVEVDESGILPGRGGIRGKRGVSYTDSGEHRLTRSTRTKDDDIMVRPGQAWCVVSSADEGDTHVQVLVPGISNWEKRIKTTVIRWVDASFEFPVPAVANSASQHELNTKIFRSSDRQPLANYRVRYKIISGPRAVLMPGLAQEVVVSSDLNGLARAGISHLGPASGVTRVSIEIIRPPDPTTPSGSAVSLFTGETSVEWLAPDVGLGQPMPLGPPMPTSPMPDVGLGQPVPTSPVPDVGLGQPVPSPEPAPRPLPPGGGLGPPVFPGVPR
jgi:hypothetical protein